MDGDQSNQSQTTFFSVDHVSQDNQDIPNRLDSSFRNSQLAMVPEENSQLEFPQDSSQSSIFGDASLLEECFYGKNVEKSSNYLDDISMVHNSGKAFDVSLPLMEEFTIEKKDPNSIIMLVNMIWYWLDNMLYGNALFACERLIALSPDDPQSIYLTALTYFRSGKYQACYDFLRSLPENLINDNSLFLLGRASLEIKELRAAEGYFRQCLTKNFTNRHKNFSKAQNLRCDGPDLGSVLLFLADTLRSSCQTKEASKYYSEAWKLNPFSWKAFEGACQLSSDPLNPLKISSNSPGKVVYQLNEKQPDSENNVPISEKPKAFERKLSPESTCNPRKYLKTKKDSSPSRTPEPVQFQHIANSGLGSENGSCILNSTYSPQKSELKVPTKQNTLSSVFELDKTCDIPKELGQLFLRLFTGYAQLMKIDPKSAIETLLGLPSAQQKTYWVQCILGRAYYEENSYPKSKEAFLKAVEIGPYNSDFMDYYSMLLWHQKDMASSVKILAQLNKFSPGSYESMITAGNLYSLKGNVMQAINSFKEADRCLPTRPTANTLIGHEYLGINVQDKALEHFHSALRYNPRHYSAWCGLGLIDLSNGKFKKSLYTLKRAVEISPCNSVVIDAYAAALIKAERFSLALDLCNKVIEAQPNNFLSRYQRAKLNAIEGKVDLAIAELKDLLFRNQREAALHITIGKLYGYQNDILNSSLHIRCAVDLSPDLFSQHKYLLSDIDSLSRDRNSRDDLKVLLFGKNDPSCFSN